MAKTTTLFIVFLFFTPLALAEDAPKYNFGTTAAGGMIFIQPGETLKVPAIYFFNIYGNRITHVSLELTSTIKGWDVRIEPELNNVQVNISGTIVNASENLYVVPSQPEKNIPSTLPEGVQYITLGGIEGNIPTKVAYLNITAPPDTPIGGTYTISVKAIGRWFGQAANLALSQERSFDFKVQTVTHNFTEEVVQTKAEENKDSNLLYIAIAVIVLAAIGIGYYAGRKK